jgi:hypothetical protein
VPGGPSAIPVRVRSSEELGRTRCWKQAREFGVTVGAQHSGDDYLVTGEPVRLLWAAAGFQDTLLRWNQKLEVVDGNETTVQSGVQA